MGDASSSSEGNNGADKMLATSMEQKLTTVSPISSECCIHRVPKKLRRVNNAAYNPRVVSIGPFHRGKKRLQKMEEHKWRYLDAFLHLDHAKPLEDYVTALRELEDSARHCYAETINLSSEEFVEMMLLDGSFIIVFLLRYMSQDGRPSRDPIFDTMWMLDALSIDMILLENQLPFFVLERLDGLTACAERQHRSLQKLTASYFNKLVKMDEILQNRYMPQFPPSIQLHRRAFTSIQLSKIITIPRILCSIPRILRSIPRTDQPPLSSTPPYKPQGKHFLDFLQICCTPSSEWPSQDCERQYECTVSVTELDEAGVKFQVDLSGNCLLDVKFSNGVLIIPHLQITDFTEPFFRNLIALEQCHHLDNYKPCVTSYSILMDSLINTPNDVALLIRYGIFENFLGSNEDVSLLFNKLSTEVSLGTKVSYFSKVCKDLNAHCKKRRHRWMATLKRDYFNTPWAAISVAAAVFLIILTIIQTLCSLISLKS